MNGIQLAKNDVMAKSQSTINLDAHIHTYISSVCHPDLWLAAASGSVLLPTTIIIIVCCLGLDDGSMVVARMAGRHTRTKEDGKQTRRALVVKL